jgi:hypothetical protein
VGLSKTFAGGDLPTPRKVGRSSFLGGRLDTPHLSLYRERTLVTMIFNVLFYIQICVLTYITLFLHRRDIEPWPFLFVHL